jgi:hypothetical protein
MRFSLVSFILSSNNRLRVLFKKKNIENLEGPCRSTGCSNTKDN